MPSLTAPWPQIDGIDSAAARDRWGDDARLFREMLERLLKESVDVAIPAARQDPAVREHYIRSIHKLRGGACMLGAKVIVELAGEVEAACDCGEMERAGTAAGRLAVELQRVRLSAERAFIVAGAESGDDASIGGVELGPHLLVELDALLRQQNPTALDRFREIGPQLEHSMGSASYRVMCRHLDHLEFEEAADELMKGAPAHDSASEARRVALSVTPAAR
jgi:HPt (histidine-containing phosphotransfer) domain-containing protein